MIQRLRKHLTVLFLTFTMLIFTAAMAVMACTTLSQVRSAEMEYISHTADSLMEQILGGVNTEELLPIYAQRLPCQVSISNGSEISSYPGDFQIPSDGLKLLFTQQAASDTDNIIVRTSLYLAQRRYYVFHSSFGHSEAGEYELTLVCPRSRTWTVLCSYCAWYPVLWLAVCLLIYLASRFLIRRAVQPVESAIKSQKTFIASASHELKTPLAVIQANAETLESTAIDFSFESKQKVILDECGRMNSLIQSMLALASSDAGNWTMDFRQVDVDTLLIETWEMFSETARMKQIHMDLNLNDHYPKLVCDRERVIQVLSILLDNAISYSPPDLAIELSARTLSKEIIFSVVDHGCGIPDDEKEKVFRRFYSGDASRSDRNHYGLGLSIAQEIVKLHGGCIRLFDTVGSGCTFEVSFPFKSST